MGSDAAPRIEVEGALCAANEGDLDVVLVGDEPRLRAILDGLGQSVGERRIELRHAPETIAMSDSPSMAVKHKKKSSMRACFEMVKAGEADAVVSAGNSGAMMACGLFVLGRVPGVERPAIVTAFPTTVGQCAILDAGANVDPRPTVLAQFAVLGAVYARLWHGKQRPRVGLLSNGTEEHKGTTLTRDAHHLLCRARDAGARAEFEYLGYVEGRDIFRGDVDVVVTDGFTGNVLLKSMEGLAEAVLDLMKTEVKAAGTWARLGAWLMRPALRGFKYKTDYAETGGALLVGTEGVALICHGGSNVRAMKNAILAARKFSEMQLFSELTRSVQGHAYVWQDESGNTPAPVSMPPPGGMLS